MSVFLLLVLLCLDSFAQVPNAGSQKLLHGSIFTSQGQPAAEVTVEIRDLRGIRVGKGVTDSSGNFEIRGTAERGEYHLIAARAFQIRDERIQIDQADPEASLALPADAGNAAPAHYTVSAKRLGVPAKAWAHLAAAHREFSKMEFGAASREVDSALRVDPACAQAFSMRAFIKLAEKDSQGAVADAKRAASLDPGDAEPFIALTMAYNSLKNFREAEEAAQHALGLRPDSWQARLELAKTFYGQGELVLALCELDLANIDFPDAHLVRGNVLMRLGRKPEAVEEFSAFMREAPGDSRGEQIQRIARPLPQVRSGANTAD
jgi:tetratricopeptide (TPR) repeat protein